MFPVTHFRLRWFAAISLALLPVVRDAGAAHLLSRRAAMDSITARGVRTHVSALADDTFEGREAGSRGGRAAAIYIVNHLKALGVRGAGERGGYYQKFGAGYGNLLGLIPGSDPVLAKQYVLVSAHYDHVGYGTARTSYGPVGLVHNGADDNASGVAALVETISALSKLEERPKRSILLAFWDGEEKGLLGSIYWLDQPTVPMAKVPIMINLDMVGRLRAQRLYVYGTRSMPGLRRMVSQQNDGLLLNFTWELKENSDHHPFYMRSCPVLMFHTGLHDDYHRPSDDAERINYDGVQAAAQLLFRVVTDIANTPALGRFRAASRSESPWTRQIAERPLPQLPGRLGVVLGEREGHTFVQSLAPTSPAARAGIRSGDRFLEIAGRKVASTLDARAAVLAATSPAHMVLSRAEAPSPLELDVALNGAPVRVGISWREDDAEPGCVAISRVVPGSPADRAGLKVHDRIYHVDGKEFAGAEDFRARMHDTGDKIRLSVERDGRVSELLVECGPPASAN